MRLAVAHHFGLVSLMRSITRGLRIAAGALCCTVLGVVSPAGATPTVGQSVPAVSESEPALVNVHCIDPTILVELRYASRRNFAQRALYPAEMPALVRPSVAYRLAAAQTFLRAHGYRLKIWDAYRPKPVHEQLWHMSQNGFFVANPEDGVGSLHTWGVAVDATLVNADGHDVSMPTDFDVFTQAASMHYGGNDMEVRAHLRILQRAMGAAGFLGMRMEWWHFVAADWKSYVSVCGRSSR